MNRALLSATSEATFQLTNSLVALAASFSSLGQLGRSRVTLGISRCNKQHSPPQRSRVVRHVLLGQKHPVGFACPGFFLVMAKDSHPRHLALYFSDFSEMPCGLPLSIDYVRCEPNSFLQLELFVDTATDTEVHRGTQPRKIT